MTEGATSSLGGAAQGLCCELEYEEIVAGEIKMAEGKASSWRTWWSGLVGMIATFPRYLMTARFEITAPNLNKRALLPKSAPFI